MAVTDEVEDGLRAAGRGATHIILRSPGSPIALQLKWLRALKSAAGIPVLAHSRAEVAMAAGAAGLHLPADDVPVPDVRRLLGEATLIGRSAHSREEVDRAAAEGADYVLYGPVFATPTHPGHPGLGLAALRAASRSSSIPVVAIGGMDSQRAAACMAEGAAGYAAIRLFQS